MYAPEKSLADTQQLLDEDSIVQYMLALVAAPTLALMPHASFS
jgi:hypothetical protein